MATNTRRFAAVAAAGVLALTGVAVVTHSAADTTTVSVTQLQAEAQRLAADVDTYAAQPAPTATVTVTPAPQTIPVPGPTVTVTQAAPTVTVTAPPVSPSGQQMPATEPAGWTRVYSAEDWTGVDLNTAFAAYPANWPDTSKHGIYSAATNTTATPGLLTITLKTDQAGVHRVTALQPNAGKGQLYGRYSVRAKMDANGRGYKTAWLLWPDDGAWPAHGEIDWPEGNIPSAPSAFAHYASTAGGQDAFSQSVSNTGWHTYTIEWSPGRVVFYLDDKVVGVSTKLVPSTPMHWVLQCETELGAGAVTPPASTVATIQIDWITIATRA